MSADIEQMQVVYRKQAMYLEWSKVLRFTYPYVSYRCAYLMLINKKVVFSMGQKNKDAARCLARVHDIGSFTHKIS